MTHITIERAELEQWLEKLVDVSEKVDYYGNDLMVGDEIKAIKAALAQDETSDSSLSRQAKRSSRAAQQEPVAWMDIDEKGSASGLRYWSEPDNRHEVALYTTPPQENT